MLIIGILPFWSRIRDIVIIKKAGALFLGQYKSAMEAVKEFDKYIPEALIKVKSPPMADLYEGYFSLKYHAYIRFGKWREILNLPPPGDPDLYLVTTAIYHYAQSLSHAALGDVESALLAQISFNSAYKKVPETRVMFNNKCVDILRQIFQASGSNHVIEILRKF